MTAIELPYPWLEARKPGFELIREFHAWRAYSDRHKLIVIDDFSRHRTFVFMYVNNADRKADTKLIRWLNDDGEQEAGVPAWLIPIPPSRSASVANPLPEDSAA